MPVSEKAEPEEQGHNGTYKSVTWAIFMTLVTVAGLVQVFAFGSDDFDPLLMMLGVVMSVAAWIAVFSSSVGIQKIFSTISVAACLVAVLYLFGVFS